MDKFKRVSLLLLIIPVICLAAGEHVPLRSANVDLNDKESLQRGAKWFMNYCSGCHSLKYARYNRVATDIGVSFYQGELDAPLLTENLIFTDAKVGDTINIAMPQKDAAEWFGVAPPDLTLEARVRGADWIYSYLTSFYVDDKATWGVNNTIFPGVAMPNVLGHLQGLQAPVYTQKTVTLDGGEKTVDVIDKLELVQPGNFTPEEFDLMAHDIANFLAYVAEPVQLERKHLGVYVLLFIGLLIVLTFALKKDYWRDIKKGDKK
jgi:ubiquinol-cytochrome c reductase cytochrome c1 subunit